MDIEEDGGLVLINKLNLEDKERHESLDKFEKRIKRVEERAPGSAEHIRLLRCFGSDG
jgi:hypothetical protein